MKDTYVFPAVLDYNEGGYTITFPDIPGCISESDTQDEALYMARDALGLRLYTDERDNDPIPEPSDILALTKALEPEQCVILVDVFMPPLREKSRNKAVNKMVTLPKWLIDEGKNAGINFSHTLHDALCDKLGYSDRKRKN